MTPTSAAELADLLAGAIGDDAQLRVLAAAAQREVALPAEVLVIGDPVTATAITYGGHPRAGLTLDGRRAGRLVRVSLADVVFPPGRAARFVSMYRAWVGLVEDEPRTATQAAPDDDVPTSDSVELIVLACKQSALRCRVLGTDRELTLRTAVADELPGAIVTVEPTKQWTHARRSYLAGKVRSMRIDAAALGLPPLILHERGVWDPVEEGLGEEGGGRRSFEMEQVLPGVDPDDFDADPIIEASERNADGDRDGARKLLMELLAQDLRCLDAHAHLGNFAFDRDPAEAQRHYEVGRGIGALSLAPTFDGVLPWAHLDNRPFLRCLHGLGLCRWRLGDASGAVAVFGELLALDPADGQGARSELDAIEAGRTWKELEEAR